MKDLSPHPVGTEKVAKPLAIGSKFLDNDDTAKYASATVNELAIWDKTTISGRHRYVNDCLAGQTSEICG